jgi:uncharacterized iron-regulated protein
MFPAVLWQAVVGLAMSFGFVSTLQAQPDFQSPPIEDCVSVRLGKTGQAIHLEQMLDDLAAADVVFLGETHNDDTTHRVELAVYEGLMARRDSKVVLAMEMFERDVQSVVDDYLGGNIEEAAFLGGARPWPNYAEAYRPMVEKAKSVGSPVIASNFPRPLRMKFAEGAEQALQSLGENRGWAPAEFLPNSEVYWKRTDNAVRGHLVMMAAAEGNNRLYSTQSLWDNSMGESCANALDRYPGHCVVHVNGGFHTAYWDGTAGQLRARKPDAKIKTVAILPATNPSSVRMRGAPVADYIVYAEQRAGNLNDGRWSVYVNRKNEYQLHVPSKASAANPVPLLIWLGDDGLTSTEGMEYWKTVLGDEVAIVSIQPPHRETQRDQSLGGRWYWNDNFMEDISAMVETIDRTWGYVLERFPIDPNRVCLAGEGTGATVVAAATLLTDRMQLSSVAIEPKRYTKIKDFSLPLLEDWGDQKPPPRSLRVIGKPTDTGWWKPELSQYASVGLKVEWADLNDDAWSACAETEAAIRAALGEANPPAATNRAQRFLLVDSQSPLHLQWARLAARRATTAELFCVALPSPLVETDAKPITVEISPETLSEPDTIPKCPGPFGGTTVLVVDAKSLPQWLELEKNDPLNKSSRFHRLRIATNELGIHHLSAVLGALQEQKRTNVLIVPAAFYAGESTMRELAKHAAHFSDQMTLHWLPGLGGQKLSLKAD